MTVNADGSSSAERVVLVAEDRGREQVQEAVVVAAPNRMMQPGRGLERNLEPAASLDELGERWDAWQHRASAAHFRSQPQLADLEDPKRDVVSERQLEVDLGRGVEQHLGVEPGRLDRFDALIGRRELARVDHDGKAKWLVFELRQLRGRADEAVDDPPVRTLSHAAVLGEALVERELLGWVGRRVVDQAGEESLPNCRCRSHAVEPMGIM